MGEITITGRDVTVIRKFSENILKRPSSSGSGFSIERNRTLVLSLYRTQGVSTNRNSNFTVMTTRRYNGESTQQVVARSLRLLTLMRFGRLQTTSSYNETSRKISAQNRDATAFEKIVKIRRTLTACAHIAKYSITIMQSGKVYIQAEGSACSTADFARYSRLSPFDRYWTLKTSLWNATKQTSFGYYRVRIQGNKVAVLNSYWCGK